MQPDPSNSDTIDYPLPAHLRGLAYQCWQVQVDIAARSHQGNVRQNNEDHYFVGSIRRTMSIGATNVPHGMLPQMLDECGHVMAVADGMGGMASGEEASRLAIVSGLELVREAPVWHFRVDDPQHASELRQQMREFFEQVDQRIAREASSDRRLFGMGTTLTVAYSVGAELFIVHAGDSRAYLHQNGVLQQITRDHTLAQDLADSGLIRPEQVRDHGTRSVLTNCIGGPEDGVVADTHQVRLADGDCLLLCSDGLTEMVQTEAIHEVLGRGLPAQQTCDALIDLALAGGGRDNVTVIVARYRFVS